MASNLVYDCYTQMSNLEGVSRKGVVASLAGGLGVFERESNARTFQHRGY